MELFMKYGGMPFWSDFIDQFYERVTKDQALRTFFVGRNVDHIKEMQVNLLEMTLSGGKFPEDVMHRTHVDLNITPSHFDRFLSLYEKTLLDLDVEPEDSTYMIDLLAQYKEGVAYGRED